MLDRDGTVAGWSLCCPGWERAGRPSCARPLTPSRTTSCGTCLVLPSLLAASRGVFTSSGTWRKWKRRIQNHSGVVVAVMSGLWWSYACRRWYCFNSAYVRLW